MKELIKITDHNGKQAVSARELYRFLVTDDNISNFGKWSKSNIIDNDFAVELTDYQTIRTMYENGRKGIDYALSINFAKELCMLSQCEKGKIARQYFIKCENVLKEVIQNQLQAANESSKQRFLKSNRILEIDTLIHSLLKERKILVKEINYINRTDFSQLNLQFPIDDILSFGFQNNKIIG